MNQCCKDFFATYDDAAAPPRYYTIRQCRDCETTYTLLKGRGWVADRPRRRNISATQKAELEEVRGFIKQVIEQEEQLTEWEKSFVYNLKRQLYGPTPGLTRKQKEKLKGIHKAKALRNR